jgi:threonine dehydratase
VAHLLDKEKLAIEPSGAISVAALLRHLRGRLTGRNIVAVLTGGNVELARLMEMVRSSG